MLPGKGQHCLFMVWFLHDPGGEILRKTRHVGQRASPPTDSLRRLWQSTRFLCGAMRASRPTRIFNVCMQLQHVLWGTVLTAPEYCLYKNLRQASVSLFHSPHAEDKALFIPAKICHGAAALQKARQGGVLQVYAAHRAAATHRGVGRKYQQLLAVQRHHGA